MQGTLSQILEAIIFVSDQPVNESFLLKVLKEDTEKAEEASEEASGWSKEQVTEALEQLLEKYADERYPFEVRKVAGGYQFFTKSAYYPYVRKAVLNKNQKRLSRAALETLAIVAYRQPITKTEIEFIRGVSSDYAMQKLLERQLVSITGRADAPGRPLLYSTSPFFMQYFGINDVTDLPKLKEFEDLAEEHLEEFKQHQASLNKPQETQEDEQAQESTAGTEEEA